MKARDRIRALEAHLDKAHETEDRATQAAGRAEARLAEAVGLLLDWLDLKNRIEHFLSSDPAGRESGRSGSSASEPDDAPGAMRSGRAAANPGGVFTVTRAGKHYRIEESGE